MSKDKKSSGQLLYEMRHMEGLSWNDIYDLFPDRNPGGLRSRYSEYKRRLLGAPPRKTPLDTRNKIEFKQTETGEAVVTSLSPRITTLEELLAAANVDLEAWRVSTYTVNTWEQHSVDKGLITLWQVKANLVPNKETLIRGLISDLRKDMIEFAPEYPKLPNPLVEDPVYMMEISIPDLHYGKYAWTERSDEDYDMDKAEEVFRYSIEQLLVKTSRFNLDQIVFIIGNDLFTADNFSGTTFKGTPQQLHGMHQEHYRKVRFMVREGIDLLQQRAPVVVYVIRGNHDVETMYYLGESLHDWYLRTDRVMVNTSAKNRAYHRYGKVLLGFTHGDEIKGDRLPLLMASETSGDWGKSVYREWHIGHTHKKSEKYYIPTAEEMNGVRVRVIPSLCAVDDWHHDKGFVQNIRDAEAFLWHKENGLEYQVTAGVDAILANGSTQY